MKEIKKIRLNNRSRATKFVKGKKEYICEWCGEAVLKGEKHYHYQDGSDWDANYRFHKECYEWALIEEKNFIFGFKSRKNKKIEKEEVENKVLKHRKYICHFWEAMRVPNQRDSVPVRRKEEIITTSSIKARRKCMELYKVAQFIKVENESLTKKEKAVCEKKKVVYQLENKNLKRRLRAVLRG